MSRRISGSAIGELHTLFRWGAMGTWTDAQLMTQFLASQEGSEAAFRVLIHRHGPMVLGVCRRILGDEHAAEDAFQATFLVLVKKAGTLRDRDLLTNWLYGVALRVASKERARGARRRRIERQAAESSETSGGDLDRVELRSVIDEEIRRLPERYRVPLVLCHVEGLRHDEVAQRLANVVAITLSVFPAVGDTPRPSPPTPVSVGHLAAVKAPVISDEERYPPTRSASAIARPISGITIDGRLDDWPKDLKSYPIQHQIIGVNGYDSEPRNLILDPDASFKVGYDRQAGWIYLAVVVRDKENVVAPTSHNGPDSIIFKSDAVEVYVDGKFSRSKPKDSSLDASKMPVLQYVGVPGEVPAYGDKWGANPSLLYTRTRERRMRMKYQREGDITTYEWAIPAYDQYPDQPTELVPGKRIGFDLAVVDKDSPKAPPAWMYWGPKYTGFKGWYAANLGELILADGPVSTSAR
jgi:RNA polymerase sigma factor (sigma-70 family)